MEEIIALLESLGIQIIKAAESELIEEAKANGSLIIEDIITASELKLTKLKVLHHLSSVGHGKIKYDIEIGAIETEIVILHVALKMLA